MGPIVTRPEIGVGGSGDGPRDVTTGETRGKNEVTG